MITCSCGKVIERVPEWLSGVKVEFVCTNCPQRQVRSITQVSAEELIPAAKVESDPTASIDELEDEDDA